MKILCCVAEKYTNRQLSEILTFDGTPFQAVDAMNESEKYPKIDGEKTHLDWAVIEIDNDYQAYVWGRP